MTDYSKEHSKLCDEKNERVDRAKNGLKRRPLPSRDALDEAFRDSEYAGDTVDEAFRDSECAGDTVDEAFRDSECAGDTVDEAFRDSECADDAVAKREMDKKMKQKRRNRPE